MPSLVMPKTISIATLGILKNNRLLAVALGADVRFYTKHACPEAVLAWGRRPSHQKAKTLAHRLGVPLLTAEDGFLRSLDSGVDSRFGASFVVDSQGIYFDLTTPNLLQTLIFDAMATWCENKQARSQSLITQILSHHLSKYNHTTNAPLLTAQSAVMGHILVIDQVAGDASISGAGADASSFYEMLVAAFKRYPNHLVWIKAHPAGKGVLVQQGALSSEAQAYLSVHLPNLDYHAQVKILTTPTNPVALLKQVDAVYTVSSHMGFEALLLDKAVHCFGVNWYAGFGLTYDEAICHLPLYQQVQTHHQMLGEGRPNIYQLFYASYILYSHYANPATGQKCEIEEVIDYLSLNQNWQERLQGKLLAYEFSRWKWDFVKGFLGFGAVKLAFKPKLLLLFDGKISAWRIHWNNQRHLAPLANDSTQHYVVWGQKSKQVLLSRLSTVQTAQGTPMVFCMEDGFIRSNGLGANLLTPLSVVLDDVGIYYDANRPSRLEQILATITLSHDDKQRAIKLQELLLTKRISKYNVGTKNQAFFDELNRLKIIKSGKVHLVIGQVEDDASVQNCTSQITKNSTLLQKVRHDFANDIVIYKPHPDVEAGLRMGQVDECTLKLADLVAHQIPMPDCLDVVDTVHTISSLTGFEALIRGRAVVCYGLPFYAGFGLTVDVVEVDNEPKLQALDRRKRPMPLTIHELIMATLVYYPIYHLPHGHGLATPEQVIEYLYQSSFVRPSSSIDKMMRFLKRKVMQIRHWR